MANKKKEPPKIQHFCRECAHGKWIEKHSNYDIYGNPIALRCKFQEWARLRGELACEHFRPKE